ncbi:MAG: heparinase II/III family protein [Planctomycetes bacterium]|nr:heparinase II/III family protein [Planctomycetota bacterium]
MRDTGIRLTLALATLLLGASGATRAADLELGFTGISLDVQGAEGTDYAVERLWYDRETDDDVILYLRSTVPIALSHNANNLVAANTPWTAGMDPGTIVYKIDGDGLRGYSGNIYQAAPAYGNPINPPLSEIQFQYSAPFTLAAFKGRLGQGDDFYRGMTDACGDEWHVLTFWDVDPENTHHERDDQTNDGKIVLVVLDPQTPCIAFEAPEGEQFYTTPPKLYYVPHVHGQKTYLTSGVRITLANITNSKPIHYQVNDGAAQAYSGPLTASDLFSQADTVYTFTYWLGDDGAKKTREIHYRPSQPATGEEHPKMLFKSPAALAEAQAIVAAGGPAASALLAPPGYIAMPNPPVDFRTGLRYLRASLYSGGYYYQTKSLAATIKEYARLGVLQKDAALMRRAADGLLFLYTIDPMGGESSDGRNGGPCQERCMYSDGRITIDAALAYDLLAAQFTPENGYANGLTPIEHIKIRDNIAGEAVMMVQFPTSNPTPFWQTARDSGSPRDVQLEMFIASLAMAVPTYDSVYYGTSGADGATEATHLWTPWPDATLTWIAVNDNGYVKHPTDPARFRYSALWDLLDEDGNHVGQARDGYLTMMHQDVIPFLVYRANFDGFHYERFEKYLMMRLRQRYPQNSAVMPQAFFEGGYNAPDTFLAALVRPEFDDAPYYRWSLQHPNALSGYTVADSSVAAAAIPDNSHVARSYAVFSSDLGDSDAVMMRMRVFPSGYWCESGTFQTYLAGAFNLSAYGERMVIEKAGYHRVASYNLGISTQRKSVVMLDGQNEPSQEMPRGSFTRALLTPALDYAEMRLDLDGSPGTSAFKQLQVNQTRRVLFADKKLFIIADALASGTGSHQYDWLLQGCTGGGTYASDATARTATWTKPGGQRLLAKMVTPAEFNTDPLYETDYIDVNTSDGRAEPYLRARTTGAAAHYLAILCPLDVGAAEPTITEITSVAGASIAKISGGPISGQLVVALRTGAAPLVHNAEFLADSDALITVYKLDAGGEPEYLAVVDGTSASLHGTSMAVNLGAQGTAALRNEPGGAVLYESSPIPPLSTITQWDIPMDHGPAGQASTAVTTGYVESRSGDLNRLHLTFAQSLNPATVGTGAVTIQAAGAGDLTSTVASVSLTSGNRVMVVTLSQSLPNADRFTVTLSDSVKDSSGGDIVGDKAMVFSRLIGDADGSGTVDNGDLTVIRTAAGHDLDGGHARYDIDRSGEITAADMQAAREHEGATLP